MKLLILFFGFYICSLPLFGQQIVRYTYHNDDKSQLKEIFHVRDTFNNILEGPYRSYYLNGNIESKGQFSNNETVGVWEFYYESGNLKMRGALRNNSNYGNWEYFYENGNKQMEGKIINRKREGPWKLFFESGDLKSEGNFTGNKRSGLWKSYFEDGKLKGVIEYTADKGQFTEYYHSGEKKAEGPKNGLTSTGRWKFYDRSGKLQAEGDFVNGKRSGEWIFYHPEGSISSKGKYSNDQPSGNWNYYHESGELSTEGVFNKGEKEGTWNSYYANGLLKSTTAYSGDKGIYKEYYENGQLKASGVFVDGVKNGTWKYYFPNGKLEGEAEFNFGRGEYRGYYEDGTLQTSGIIENDQRVGTWEIFDTSGTLKGYYKPFYENDSLSFNELLKADKPVKTERSYGIAAYGFNKKKFKYFNPKVNEFQGLILSANPLMSFIGRIPVGAELYFSGRLGYEILFEGLRDPFFTENEKVSLNSIYSRGYMLSIRQKFYNPDDKFGLFYFGHSLNYVSASHFVNIHDELSKDLIIREAKENKYLYQVIAGYRLMQKIDRRGFTADGYLSIGTGYRTFNATSDGGSDFESLPKNKIPFDFSFGINFGYVYPFKK